MNQDWTRAIIAILVVLGFFAFIGIVLFGFVDVAEPTLAKLVGLMFGDIAGLLQPIIVLYFGSVPSGPPPPGD